MEQALAPAESSAKSTDKHTVFATEIMYKEVVIQYSEATNKYLQYLDLI